MAILMSLGVNNAGDGFLLAPAGSVYEADITLSTDSGTASVTLQASPNPAGLVFSQTAVSVSTVPTVVKVRATLQSASRGDTTIQVLDGAAVVKNFTVTSIKHPVVNFKGRFEVRFATDSALFNQNPMYTPTNESVGPGWTWGLEGEPDFVPAVGNVPENLETTGVGRVLRYNNPVALRSLGAGTVPAVVSSVDSISGETAGGTEKFTSGDPLIGQLVNLGPDTYLAGNNTFGSPAPEEIWGVAKEPMGLFELHLGNLFSGKSKVGPFTHKTVTGDEHTRTPDSRPIADGNLYSASADLAEFGLPSLVNFSMARVDALVVDYNALPAGDSPLRRNLARRIGHLVGYLINFSGTAAGIAKGNQVKNLNPTFAARTTTLTGGWPSKEIYTGYVDANLTFNPAGSSVIAYLSGFQLFKFVSSMFAFHSDELCGYHKGTLQAHVSSNGSYTGDPHTHTVNGKNYDFQSVGEFTLLRDGGKMEIQVRQTPVATANPVTDSHSGLTACVSVITAVAARVGSHRIAFQPGREGRLLEFFVDGKHAGLSAEGINLGGSRVSAFDANGETGLRVDYEDGTVLLATPAFWNGHNIWYINVSVSNTKADEGIMGIIPKDSWLPRLRNGQDLGPRPASLQDRHAALYHKFADSWRVTDKTSLFVYASGTSTKTFTDPDWPADKPPCKLKPEFQIPGVAVHKGIPVEEARMICRAVTMKDLHQSCVFDVATTGDKTFANGYLLAQELRLYGTSIQIAGHKPAGSGGRIQSTTEQEPNRRDHSLIVTATVIPLTPGRPTPTGTVTFFVDGVPMKRPAALDGSGRARLTLKLVKPGGHLIRATYSGGGKYDYHSCTSPNLVHSEKREEDHDGKG